MSLPIKIYTLSTCSHCKAAKKLLNDCGASFDCVDVDLLTGKELFDMIKEVMEYNPQCSFPTILIATRLLWDFRKSDFGRPWDCNGQHNAL